MGSCEFSTRSGAELHVTDGNSNEVHNRGINGMRREFPKEMQNPDELRFTIDDMNEHARVLRMRLSRFSHVDGTVPNSAHHGNGNEHSMPAVYECERSFSRRLWMQPKEGEACIYEDGLLRLKRPTRFHRTQQRFDDFVSERRT